MRLPFSRNLISIVSANFFSSDHPSGPSDEAGYPRLTDLGLCAFVRDPAERLTQHCGTRSYMAPEQSYGDAGYGKVCIVLYSPCFNVLL